jgi:predicted DNA-binding protein
MAVSVRLDPTLEERLKQEARRLGVTQSAFITDAIERVLGLKDPATLLAQVRSGAPTGRSNASENISQSLKDRLRAKHSD